MNQSIIIYGESVDDSIFKGLCAINQRPRIVSTRVFKPEDKEPNVKLIFVREDDKKLEQIIETYDCPIIVVSRQDGDINFKSGGIDKEYDLDTINSGVGILYLFKNIPEFAKMGLSEPEPEPEPEIVEEKPKPKRKYTRRKTTNKTAKKTSKKTTRKKAVKKKGDD